MKNKMTKILGLGIILAAFSTGVNAQNTSTDVATATAIIVEPLSITKDIDMHFGEIVLSGAAGQVVLSPTGTRTPNNGITFPATGTTPTAAYFDVTGTAGYLFNITLPSTNVTLTEPVSSDVLTAHTFLTSLPSNGLQGTLDTNGDFRFSIGATLEVGATQAPGTYVSADFPVTVTYN